MSTHTKIVRINHPGYCPKRWCAVCGKAATKNAPYVCCDGETDCPNVCHATCLGDRETFTCTETQQLRQVANINVTVSYVDGDISAAAPTPSAPPAEDEEAPVIHEEDTDRQMYMEMEKEAIVTDTLRFKHELSRSHIIIQSLTLQRDWILEKKPTDSRTVEPHGSPQRRENRGQ